MSVDLLSWKKKYGSIYLITIDGAPFYFRPLTVQEFTILDEWPEIIDPILKEESVLESTLLYPDEVPIAQHLASRSHLAQQIMVMSMPTSEEEHMARVDVMRRTLKANPHKLLVINICSIYPTFSPLDLMECTFEKLTEIATLVEKITGKFIIGSKRMRPPGLSDQPSVNIPDTKPLFNRKKKITHDPNELALAHKHKADEALQSEMEKFTGKRVKTLEQRTAEKDSKMSALHQQMSQFKRKD